MLDSVVAHPLAAGPMSSYVHEANAALGQALRANGWRPGAAQLEMSRKVCSGHGDSPAGHPIRALADRIDPLFLPAAEMLGRHHRWPGDPAERLGDYLDDGYRVSVIESSGELAACALWIHIDDTDFGRLDYLSVGEGYRRRFMGIALTRHVLAEAAADMPTGRTAPARASCETNLRSTWQATAAAHPRSRRRYGPRYRRARRLPRSSRDGCPTSSPPTITWYDRCRTRERGARFHGFDARSHSVVPWCRRYRISASERISSGPSRGSPRAIPLPPP